MLLRQRQLLNKVHALIDATLFGGVFWMAHFIRSLPQLDPDAVIGDFNKYQWLLLVVVPLTPPLLELQGFYHRAVLASRRQSLAQILRGSAWVSLAIIVAMFFTKQEVARGVVSLFLPMVVTSMILKEELMRLWIRSRMAGQEARRRVILIGGDREMNRLDEALKQNARGEVSVAARLDPGQFSVSVLTDLLHSHAANAVLVAPKQFLFGQIEKIIQVCELEGVEVWLHADFFQTRVSQTTVDELAGHPVLVFRTGPDQTWQSMAKG